MNVVQYFSFFRFFCVFCGRIVDFCFLYVIIIILIIDLQIDFAKVFITEILKGLIKMNLKKIVTDTIPLIVTVCSIVVLAVMIYFDSMIVQNEFNDYGFKEIEKIKVEIEVDLENNIEESEDDLSLVAEFAEKNDVTEQTAVEFLNTQSQVQEFESLFYVDLNGDGVSADGTTRSFSNSEAFKGALNDEFVITNPTISSITGEYVLEVAVPVFENEEIAAVLISENSIQEIYDNIYSLMGKIGHAYIVDRQANIIFSTDSSFIQSNTLDDESLFFLNNQNIRTIYDDLKNGVGGNMSFELDGSDAMLLYTPIDLTPWSLMLAVDQGMINDTLLESVNSVIYLCIGSILILVAFTLYTWYTRRRLLRSIEKSAYIDTLTEIPNVTKLKIDMQNILSKNKDEKYSIIKMDIDNFNAINELFSVEIGNRVLKAFKNIRDSVDEPSLIIARLGGDEFFLFSGNGFLDDMETRTHIYEAQYNMLIPELGDYRIGLKYGRYHIEPGETDVDDIINKASMAHKMAKDKKEKIIYDYDDNYKKMLMESGEIINTMKSALENKEFKLYLQPKFSTGDERLIGAEALVRWIKDDGTIVYPDKFIPLMEKTGFITELDRYMLENACKLIRGWIDAKTGYLPISVNFSRLNLLNKDFVSNISEIIDRHDIPHGFIEVEITESTMIEQEEKIEKLFTHLHKAGFRISIDDFGSGFSSLGLLKNLKADVLKLDKAFFNNKRDVVRGDVIIDGIIKLAQSLNMYVVAEGVEEEEQVDFLNNIGCDAIQGYYYSKPIPCVEFEAKYKDAMPQAIQAFKQSKSLFSTLITPYNQNFDIALATINSLETPAVLFNYDLSQFSSNKALVSLFGLKNLRNWRKEFLELSLEQQDAGGLSRLAAKNYVLTAKQEGSTKFKWSHEDRKGVIIQCEVDIKRVNLLDNNGDELYIAFVKPK